MLQTADLEEVAVGRRMIVPAFRITKYNPCNRDSAGRYLTSEWTSVSDVGKTCDGHRVTLGEYLSAEDGYVAAVQALMGLADVQAVQVTALEGPASYAHLPERLIESSRAYRRVVREGKFLQGEHVGAAVRLALREVVWFRLQGDRGFYVHFGYDYYMYAGFDGKIASLPQIPEGMFLEEFESPRHG